MNLVEKARFDLHLGLYIQTVCFGGFHYFVPALLIDQLISKTVLSIVVNYFAIS